MPIQVARDCAWPMHALPPESGDWAQCLHRTVRAVVGECGLPDDLPAATPLLVASSSLEVGDEGRTQFGELGDMQRFADYLAALLYWRGPVFTVSTACTSAANALLAAMDLLRNGAATQALVLGIEFSNRYTLAGFGGMQLLSPDRARPFGADRNGLVLGEAVVALRLSTTPSRWRLSGGANQISGATPTGADAQAMTAACHAALRQAGLATSDIDLVKPQASGSPGNDAIEAEALRDVFSPRLPPMVEFKSLMGHTLGASTAAELALLTACRENGAWPTMRHAPDPALGITFADRPPARCRHILLNTIGFGGGHAALLLEDCHA
ncbi:MAG: beta-ketoacyl synthase [Gallionellaceae bacterium]|nr:beta-ketoacyl synthase [Gallionellaceae bacterium]